MDAFQQAIEDELASDPEIQRRRSIVRLLNKLGPGHWHITVTEDGECTAVPMEEAPESTYELADGVWHYTALWTDVKKDNND